MRNSEGDFTNIDEIPILTWEADEDKPMWSVKHLAQLPFPPSRYFGLSQSGPVSIDHLGDVTSAFEAAYRALNTSGDLFNLRLLVERVGLEYDSRYLQLNIPRVTLPDNDAQITEMSADFIRRVRIGERYYTVHLDFVTDPHEPDSDLSAKMLLDQKFDAICKSFNNSAPDVRELTTAINDTLYTNGNGTPAKATGVVLSCPATKYLGRDGDQEIHIAHWGDVNAAVASIDETGEDLMLLELIEPYGSVDAITIPASQIASNRKFNPVHRKEALRLMREYLQETYSVKFEVIPVLGREPGDKFIEKVRIARYETPNPVLMTWSDGTSALARLNNIRPFELLLRYAQILGWVELWGSPKELSYQICGLVGSVVHQLESAGVPSFVEARGKWDDTSFTVWDNTRTLRDLNNIRLFHRYPRHQAFTSPSGTPGFYDMRLEGIINRYARKLVHLSSDILRR